LEAILTEEKQDTWVQAGMDCMLLLGFKRGERTPVGFKTEVMVKGKRIGRMAVRVQKFCPSGCHVYVNIIGDDAYHPLTVELEDLKPIAEA
jgi:hypothetical protein